MPHVHTGWYRSRSGVAAQRFSTQAPCGLRGVPCPRTALPLSQDGERGEKELHGLARRASELLRRPLEHPCGPDAGLPCGAAFSEVVLSYNDDRWSSLAASTLDSLAAIVKAHPSFSPLLVRRGQ